MLLMLTRVIQPTYGAAGIESLAKAALPVALAAVAQAIVVIAGGIDLSVGSMMALTNVTAAALMHGNSDEFAVLVVLLVLLQGLLLGVINGALVVVTQGAGHRGHAGDVLRVGRRRAPRPQHAERVRRDMAQGPLRRHARERVGPQVVPAGRRDRGASGYPLRRSRHGLSLYAVGSDRLAAFRSGVSIERTKVMSYALCGLFSAMGGLALTMATGIGTPRPGPYTLASVAAIVLGGVSLAGGRGGLLGVVVAVFILRLVRTDLTFLGIDPNYTTVIEGLVMVVVVMVGAVVALRRKRV